MTDPQATDEIIALFRKAISFQDRNRLELVFETEEEADAAGDFLLRLGDDVTHRPVPSAAEHLGTTPAAAMRANEGSIPSGPAEQRCDCNYDDCRICFPDTRG